ncbi:MAG: YlqD family protein [Bacillales bacterium]|nr:YlqD family protein [Bacillales bacterium]
MEIIQKVVIKQVLTEKSKEWLLRKYSTKIEQLEKECAQLQFEQKKIEKEKKFSPSQVRSYFEKEIDKRKEKMKQYEFQLRQLDVLPLGSEIKEQELEAVVTVEIGDRWDEVAKGKTIVVKDGIIIDIREG